MLKLVLRIVSPFNLICIYLSRAEIVKESSTEFPTNLQEDHENSEGSLSSSSEAEVEDSNISQCDTHASARQRKVRKLLLPSHDPSVKKPKLRTSKDIFDRLKWDSESIEIEANVQVDISSVYIGYKDRFLGMCELPYEDFSPGDDIPFHRIYYFRTGGPPVQPFIGENGEVKVREDNWPSDAVILWDRETRTDLIFKSGNSSFSNDQKRTSN